MYVKDGIYGELEWIRGPVTKPTQNVDPKTQPEDSNTEAKITLAVRKRPCTENIANEALDTNLDITGSTLTEMGKNSKEIVTTESAGN